MLFVEGNKINLTAVPGMTYDEVCLFIYGACSTTQSWHAVSLRVGIVYFEVIHYFSHIIIGDHVTLLPVLIIV